MHQGINGTYFLQLESRSINLNFIRCVVEADIGGYCWGLLS